MERVSTDELKEFALTLGFQTVGVCLPSAPPHIDAYRDWLKRGWHGEMSYLSEHLHLKEHPEKLLPSVQSVVACALNYYRPIEHKEGDPRVARYALGRDYHKVIRKKLRRLSEFIKTAHPGAECRACVDSAPIMERDFAQLAGLGFFGKNTMLIDPRRGSWFFIGLLLTTAPYVPDEALDGSCGTCTRCIDACPTGAILFDQERWQLDARKCISYLTIEKKGEIDPELQPLVGSWTFGCDVCQEVCPFNQERERRPQRATQTSEIDFRRETDWPTLRELADINEERWDHLTRGSAIRRAGYDGLRRNAEINLRNLATSKTD